MESGEEVWNHESSETVIKAIIEIPNNNKWNEQKVLKTQQRNNALRVTANMRKRGNTRSESKQNKNQQAYNSINSN